MCDGTLFTDGGQPSEKGDIPDWIQRDLSCLLGIRSGATTVGLESFLGDVFLNVICFRLRLAAVLDLTSLVSLLASEAGRLATACSNDNGDIVSDMGMTASTSALQYTCILRSCNIR